MLKNRFMFGRKPIKRSEVAASYDSSKQLVQNNVPPQHEETIQLTVNGEIENVDLEDFLQYNSKLKMTSGLESSIKGTTGLSSSIEAVSTRSFTQGAGFVTANEASSSFNSLVETQISPYSNSIEDESRCSYQNSLHLQRQAKATQDTSSALAMSALSKSTLWLPCCSPARTMTTAQTQAEDKDVDDFELQHTRELFKFREIAIAKAEEAEDWAKAVIFLREMLEDLPVEDSEPRVQLQIYLAKVLLLRNLVSEARETIESLDTTIDLPASWWAILYNLHAIVAIRTNNLDLARTKCFQSLKFFSQSDGHMEDVNLVTEQFTLILQARGEMSAALFYHSKLPVGYQYKSDLIMTEDTGGLILSTRPNMHPSLNLSTSLPNLTKNIGIGANHSVVQTDQKPRPVTTQRPTFWKHWISRSDSRIQSGAKEVQAGISESSRSAKQNKAWNDFLLLYNLICTNTKISGSTENISKAIIDVCIECQKTFARRLFTDTRIREHEIPTNENYMAIHVAAQYGKIGIIDILLGLGQDIDATTSTNRETALHVAATYSTFCLVHLISKGANIHARDKYDTTILHRATSSGKIDSVHFLLGRGINPMAINNLGQTPLHLAAALSSGGPLIADLLINAGADIKADEQHILGYAPLHVAAKHGRVQMVDFLIRAGVDVNQAVSFSNGKMGPTPLDVAGNNSKMVALLLKHGGQRNCDEENVIDP